MAEEVIITPTDVDRIIAKLEEVKKEALMRFPEATFWNWKVLRKENEILNARGGKTDIINESGSGYLYYATLITTNPDIVISIQIKSDEREILMSNSIRDMENAGWSDSSILKVLRWDDFNLRYVIEYIAGITGFPGTPYRKKNALWITNPSVTPAVVTGTGLLITVKEGT